MGNKETRVVTESAEARERRLERQNSYNRARRLRFTPEERRNEQLRGRYGLTIEERDAMFEAQGRCCAVCKAETPGWKHDWCVDHDHKLNRIRGILCYPCNRLLGHVRDDVSRLQAFIDYIRLHRLEGE